MMKVQVKKVVVLFLVATVLGFSCKKAGAGSDQTADAVTEASEMNKFLDLPEPSYTYEVIGHVEGIRKYVVKFNDDIYRGGQITEAVGAQTLKDRGIKTIISVTPDDEERAFCREFGFKLIELPFTHASVPGESLETFLKVIEEEEKPFYIHCHGGSHRAGALTAAYRIYCEGWSFEDAESEFYKLGANPEKEDAKTIMASIK